MLLKRTTWPWCQARCFEKDFVTTACTQLQDLQAYASEKAWENV